MTNSKLVVLQTKQILGNPYFNDTEKLRMLNAVVKNDFGKLTAAQAKRLIQIRRGFATVSTVGVAPTKFDSNLIRRGLAFYRVDRKKRTSMFGDRKPYTNKTLVISAIAERAVQAFETARQVRWHSPKA